MFKETHHHLINPIQKIKSPRSQDEMSLEERTLVVRNIDGDRLTADLLEELFANFGPVVKVVLRKSFAFIEFTVKVSVGYAW